MSSSSSMYQPVVPDYVTKYPHIQQTVPRVYQMLRQLPPANDRPSGQDGQFEIEARFGTITNDARNTFQAGVTPEFMNHCLSTASTYGDWKQITDWEETHDYYYELPPHPEDLRGQGILVRTTTSFIGDKINTTHTFKQVRDKCDFRYTPNILSGMMHNMPGYDVRVSLNFEEKVPTDSIPTRIQPKFVRIKNRKSFVYQPPHTTQPIWSIDFTRSWSAATRSEAEEKQKRKQTVFEIEIECLDPYLYMSDPRRDHHYLATSLMLKVRDFIGADKQFCWEPMYKFN